MEEAQLEIESLGAGAPHSSPPPTAVPAGAAHAARGREAPAASARVCRRTRRRIRSPMSGVLYALDVAERVPRSRRRSHRRPPRPRARDRLRGRARTRPRRRRHAGLPSPGMPCRPLVERSHVEHPDPIVTLGSRQVGEVTVVVDNPGLVPHSRHQRERRGPLGRRGKCRDHPERGAAARRGTVPGVFKLAQQQGALAAGEARHFERCAFQFSRDSNPGDLVALPVDAR